MPELSSVGSASRERVYAWGHVDQSVLSGSARACLARGKHVRSHAWCVAVRCHFCHRVGPGLQLHALTKEREASFHIVHMEAGHVRLPLWAQLSTVGRARRAAAACACVGHTPTALRDRVKEWSTCGQLAFSHACFDLGNGTGIWLCTIFHLLPSARRRKACGSACCHRSCRSWRYSRWRPLSEPLVWCAHGVCASE